MDVMDMTVERAVRRALQDDNFKRELIRLVGAREACSPSECSVACGLGVTGCDMEQSDRGQCLGSAVQPEDGVEASQSSQSDCCSLCGSRVSGSKPVEGVTSSASSSGRKVHQSRLPYRCDWVDLVTGQQCRVVLSQKRDLNRHVRTVHEREGRRNVYRERSFTCTKCKRGFVKQDSLKKHMGSPICERIQARHENAQEEDENRRSDTGEMNVE